MPDRKIDMKANREEYNFDQNYLKKMKDDMSFLKECQILKKYFFMNNEEIDAFLTNFAPKANTNEIYSKNNLNKVKIPVSDELNKNINKNRYILIQESFFYNMRDGGNQINFTKSNQDKNKQLKNKIFSCDDLYKENKFETVLGNQIKIIHEEKTEKTNFKLQNKFLRQKESLKKQLKEASMKMRN